MAPRNPSREAVSRSMTRSAFAAGDFDRWQRRAIQEGYEVVHESRNPQIEIVGFSGLERVLNCVRLTRFDRQILIGCM